MPIDPDQLLALAVAPVEQRYDAKDCILYALGVGLGADPLQPASLRFVYERDLAVLPTFASVLAYSRDWMNAAATGIDWRKAVHGEQHMRFARLLPPAAMVRGTLRIRDVIDKGVDKGALLIVEHVLSDAASGAALCTTTQTIFCRGDGGFGGRSQPSTPTTPARAIPDRAPDHVCDLPTRPEAALIYRLSGDRNPLHVDPAAARIAGYPRPILHGLASFGVAGHALLKALCGYDPARLSAIGGRFSAPVYPGETIRTEMWLSDNDVTFRCRVPARDVTVIGNGNAIIAA
jgi:acyl dehydratase